MEMFGRKGYRRFGDWPGHGPFSYLPPWQRPGWLYGPGACWWLYAPRPPAMALTPEEEIDYLKNHMERLKQELELVQERIKQLEESKSRDTYGQG
ncbi:MAG: hypothetical protein ACP5PX_00230 [Candidatus Hadarchaeum sp.]|uniref:hypothetical protein n=1 Tax=Candidatus Hadarchaeum sp. TaxID=2883567 RepID=UPI003D0FD2D7